MSKVSKLKKLGIMLIVSGMLMSMLTACGGSDNKAESTTAVETTVEASESVEETTAEAADAEESTEAADAEESTEASKEEAASEANAEVAEETTEAAQN